MKRIVEIKINFNDVVSDAEVMLMNNNSCKQLGFHGLVDQPDKISAVALGYNDEGFLIEAKVIEDVDINKFKNKAEINYQNEIVRRAFSAYNILPVPEES